MKNYKTLFSIILVKPIRVFLFTFLMISMVGCSVFGVRTTEELKYNIVTLSDDIEIREYKPYIAATTSMQGSYEAVQSDLFRTLAGYIFGKNSTDSKIAMTAPVQTNPEIKASSEKIDMTAPVLMQSESTDLWSMTFSMPSKYTIQTLPKPLDSKIMLIEVPAKKIAVIRFSGSYDDLEKRRSKAAELLDWLAAQQYKAVSKPVFAGYDPPFTLPFLRRNEVLIEIER